MQNYTPTHLDAWRMPSHYFGPGYDGHYVFLGQNRDSDCLTRSNYRVALKRLEPLNTEDGEGNSTVYDVRDSHFLCGWIEYILISATNEAALRAADAMAARLEDYPVLCEEDWSELESEEADAAWQGLPLCERIALCREGRVSIFAARQDYPPSDDQGTIQHRLLAA
jgi:hypothetical protein